MATTIDKKIINSGLSGSVGIVSVDGDTGPFVDLSNKYAGKSFETTVSELSETVEGKADASDLEDYLKIDEIDKNLTDYVKGSALDTKLQDYAKTTDLASVYTAKGSVDKYEDLEAKKASAKTGDVWNSKDTGMNYVFTEEKEWDALGETTQGLAKEADVQKQLEAKADATKVSQLETTVGTKANAADVYTIAMGTYELKDFTGSAKAWTASITLTGLENAEYISPDLAPATANAEIAAWTKAQMGSPTVSGNVLTYTSGATDKPTDTFHIQVVGFGKPAPVED